MAANTPTTSALGAAPVGAATTGTAGVQARQPRIQAAMPWATSSAAASPAREPSANAVARSAS